MQAAYGFPIETNAPTVSLRSARRDACTARGFTLVELMIVVVIVGILSLMAVGGYRKLISASHMAEATHMVGAIRVAQEAYKAETGSYADISNKLAHNAADHDNLYPQLTASVAHPGNFKVGWGAPCASGACKVDWRTLPVHADGSTMFGYSTIAGVAGDPPTTTVTIGGANYGWPTTIPTDWYVITAVGDTNGNGVYCTVLGSSFTNDLAIDNDGE